MTVLSQLRTPSLLNTQWWHRGVERALWVVYRCRYKCWPYCCALLPNETKLSNSYVAIKKEGERKRETEAETKEEKKEGRKEGKRKKGTVVRTKGNHLFRAWFFAQNMTSLNTSIFPYICCHYKALIESPFTQFRGPKTCAMHINYSLSPNELGF